MDKNNYLYSKFAKNELGESRIVLVIPSKAVKKAVLRNKLRRTREILRKNSISIRKGHDLVIIFQKGSENLDFRALQEELIKELNAKKLKK